MRAGSRRGRVRHVPDIRSGSPTTERQFSKVRSCVVSTTSAPASRAGTRTNSNASWISCSASVQESIPTTGLPTRTMEIAVREYSTPAPFTIGDDESVVHTVFTHAEKTPHRVMYSRPQGDDWVAVTAQQFADQVKAVAKGLIANGVQPGDRVALLSATRYEWSLFDYAIWT